MIRALQSKHGSYLAVLEGELGMSCGTFVYALPLGEAGAQM